MYKKGMEHHNTKPKEYYETHSVVKQSFKRTCKRMGWDFNSFKAIFDKYKITYSLQKIALYFFKNKEVK